MFIIFPPLTVVRLISNIDLKSVSFPAFYYNKLINKSFSSTKQKPVTTLKHLISSIDWFSRESGRVGATPRLWSNGGLSVPDFKSGCRDFTQTGRPGTSTAGLTLNVNNRNAASS